MRQQITSLTNQLDFNLAALSLFCLLLPPLFLINMHTHSSARVHSAAATVTVTVKGTKATQSQVTYIHSLHLVDPLTWRDNSNASGNFDRLSLAILNL